MKAFAIFLIILANGACHSNRKAGTEGCGTVGVVKDYTGLDGCGLLIELESGDRLNPAKIKDDLPLKDGQKIKFSYKVLPDMMSICMAEKAIVEITCIEVMNGQTNTDCTDTENPFTVPWMDKAIDRHNPQQVVRYKFKDEWAYLFKAIPVSYFYDCHGKLLCQTTGDRQDNCHQKYMKQAGKGKIIWQGEGVWD